MKVSEKRVPRTLEDIDDLLEQALGKVDSIEKENRTEMMDKLLHTVADSIFEAREWLSKIDTSMIANTYVSERIRLRRPRIKKTSKEE